MKLSIRSPIRETFSNKIRKKNQNGACLTFFLTFLKPYFRVAKICPATLRNLSISSSESKVHQDISIFDKKKDHKKIKKNQKKKLWVSKSSLSTLTSCMRDNLWKVADVRIDGVGLGSNGKMLEKTKVLLPQAEHLTSYYV